MANRVMKDSGIDWIGDIPNKWEIKKGKYVFVERFSNGNNICLQLLSPTQKYGVIPQKLYEKYSTQRTVKIDNNKDLSSFKTIKKGDYCISLRSFQGGFEYSSYEGVVSPAYKVFYPKIEINRYYFKYLFKDKGFISKIASYSDSLRDGKSISFNEFGNTLLPIPPLKEQKLIADYLDNKCNEIDKLKEDITKQIDILKEYKQSIITETVTKGLNSNVPMKDSGIDWIGNIPNKWKIGKNKFYLSIFGRIGFRGYTQADLVNENNGAITLSPSNFKDMKMIYENCSYISWSKYYESPEIQIKNNDILFVKTGSTYGKSVLVHDLPMEATINPQIVVFKNLKIDTKFCIYFLQSNLIKYQIEKSVVGGTIPTISQNKIENYYILLPPISEQKIIANYLDNKCAEIDKIISSKEKQLNTLEEYKK